MAAVIAAIALMAAVAVWLLVSDREGAAGQPQSAGPTPSEAASPAPASEPPSEAGTEAVSTAPKETRAERLARLRKTDAFVEFANWDRARTAPNYERAWSEFGWYDSDRDGYVRFVNAKQLWNEVVAPVRDDLLLTGPEYRGQILEDKVRGGITGVPERQGHEAQLVAFVAPFQGPDGTPMGRVNAVLIDVADEQGLDTYGRGRLRARMKPFTLSPADYTTNAEFSRRGIRPRLEAWAKENGG